MSNKTITSPQQWTSTTDFQKFLNERWPSMNTAARDLGVSVSLISRILMGERALSHHIRLACEAVLLKEQLVQAQADKEAA